MKKSVKIMSTILLVIMLLATVASVAFAAADPTNVLTVIDNTSINNDGGISTVGGKIVNIIQIVGIVVAVIVLLVIGIKYMVGSASEKAEYKKTMIPYLVGAVLIFAGTSIVKVVYEMATQISTT